MAQRRSTKTEIRSEIYRPNFEKFSTCQPLADDCTRGFYLKTGIQIVLIINTNCITLCYKCSGSPTIDTISSFEHK